MPKYTGGETVFGIRVGTEYPPIIIGEIISSKSAAEIQLIEDRQEFPTVKLGVVDIKPGEKYEVATMATPSLH